MEGGKLLAEFLQKALAHGNYDREVMALWHDIWMEKFGYDFSW